MLKTMRIAAIIAAIGLAVVAPSFAQDSAAGDTALIAQWQSLTPGDQSTLPQALRAGDAVLMTAEGSANDAFWTVLTDRGWMRRVDPPEGLPSETRTYVITEAGRRPLARFLAANPAASTSPETAFYEDLCGAMFQPGDKVYSRPEEEMPWVAMFALGYYAAATPDGLSVNEIATRKDVIPGLRQRCLDRPDETFLTALSESIPAPLAGHTPAGETGVPFGGACGDVFGPPPESFKGNPNQFTMLVHFALGYYTAKGRAWDISPADLDDRRDLMPMIYDNCMRDLQKSLTDALDETVPGAG
ncbi:hypothetical protein [Pacificispira sp.]|uniref:hypothetical protein n=1 Tax=Pacificispira sp. TaxID=2888761 RepID=UPI003BACE30D